MLFHSFVEGKERLLKRHNELRRKVASGLGSGAAAGGPGGGTLPSGAIPDLAWDDALARGAQERIS